MKIAFDAVNANKSVVHGSANYLSNLIGNIVSLSPSDGFYLYVDRPVEEQSRFEYSNVIYRYIRETKYLYGICKRTLFQDPWPEFFVALDLLRTRPDIYVFNAGSLPPFFRLCQTVCTIHDLSEYHIPDCYPDKARFVFLSNKPRSLRAATRIAALSFRTREDTVKFTGIPNEKIKVIYPGHDERVFNLQRDEECFSRLKTKFGIPGRFVITTGLVHPKKNLLRLARAFKSVKRAGEFEGQLLLVGPDSYRSDEIRREVTNIDSEGDIIFAGCLPLPEMAELIKNAELFVFPALYEGFGLSMLEAMACGIPVVAANTGALPEVAQGNALLIDPYNEDEMSQAIARALNDGVLRERLREGALKRARQFSWDKTARQYLALFAEMAG